jgi:hypothetical protein
MSLRSEIRGVSGIELSLLAELVSILSRAETDALELLVSSTTVFSLLIDEIDTITGVLGSGDDSLSLAFSPIIGSGSGLVVDIICAILPLQMALWLYRVRFQLGFGSNPVLFR